MSHQFTIRIAKTPEEVIAAQKIRQRIFVDEQEIPAHLDADGLDDSAFHALCYVGDEVVATGRLFVLEPQHGAIARIAVLPEYRGRGVGRLVIEKLEAVATDLGLVRLTIHPHANLETYYGSLGYERVSGSSVVGKHELITMRKIIGPSPGGSAG